MFLEEILDVTKQDHSGTIGQFRMRDPGEEIYARDAFAMKMGAMEAISFLLESNKCLDYYFFCYFINIVSLKG